MTNLFASQIAAAERREAAVKAELLAASQVRIVAKPVKTEAELLAELLIEFGRGFLFAVANRVVRADKWSADYIRLIGQYSEDLLRRSECELPKIDPRHANLILDKFEYGLWLNPDVPTGTFFGQRLLAEREANAITRPAPIEYVRPVLVTGDREAATTVTAPAPSAQLPPAITPKGVRGGRKAQVA